MKFYLFEIRNLNEKGFKQTLYDLLVTNRQHIEKF